MTTTSYCVCFFIDGLDEFQGDQDDLMDVISEISQNPSVKCCLSSRSDRLFREAFGQSSMLKLQDLTRQDIREYVEANLQSLSQLKRLPIKDQEARQRLFDEMTAKAQGVFLWVQLAIESLINGIRYNDGFEILVERLFALPVEVEGLYMDMLERIDPIHHHEAAKYLGFTMVSHRYYQEVGQYIGGYNGIKVTETINRRGYPLSVFDHTLATHCLDDDLRVKEQKFETSEIASKCAITADRISSICAGFLEIPKYGPEEFASKESESEESGSEEFEPEESESEESEYEEPKFNDAWTAWEQNSAVREQFDYDWQSRRVIFCHRTALDFFTRKDSGGANFLNLYFPKISNPRFLMAALELAKLKLCNLVEPFEYFSFYVSHIMSIFHSNERDRDEIHDIQWADFLNYVDGIIASFIDQQFSTTSHGTHWCTRLWLQNFHRRTQRCLPDRKRGSVAIIHQNLPYDFLGLIARFRILPYMRHAITQTNLVNGRERATHLAFNLMAYTSFPPGSLDCCYVWEINSHKILDVVSKLVSRGADPQVGLGTSIWEEAFHFIIGQYLWRYSAPMPEGFDLHQCLKNFIDAGVDLFPTVTLESYLLDLSILDVFECDPLLLPTVYRYLQGYVDTSSLENSRQTESKPKILRFWFLTQGVYWPPGGHPLSQEQMESLHTAIERLISCPDLMINESKSELEAVFEDIRRSCTPPSINLPYNGCPYHPDCHERLNIEATTQRWKIPFRYLWRSKGKLSVAADHTLRLHKANSTSIPEAKQARRWRECRRG